MKIETLNKALDCWLSGNLADRKDDLSLEQLVGEGVTTSGDLEIYKKGMEFMVGALCTGAQHLKNLIDKYESEL